MSRFPTELRRWRTARRLSQLELAIRADTTQRHVSFIEQGRSRPGRNVVVRLAESLDLTLRERNELLLAAGFAPAFPESPLDDAALRPVRQALDTILDGHLPYPAMVVRPHGILVTANRAFDLFNEGVDPALLAPPANMFRHALHPNGLAPRVRNLPEWGRHITEHLRAQLVRSPDPSLEELLAELEGYLPPLPDGGRRARLRRAAGAGLGRWRPPAHHDDHVVRDRRRRDARRAAPRGVPARRRSHRRGAAPPMGVTIDDARAIAATLPRSYEALVRDEVRFRVGRMVYAAFYDDETIMGFGFPRDEREALVASEPDKFLMPRPSDMRYRWVCVRLDAIDVDELRELLVDAWRMCVPKKVAAAYEG